MVYSQDLPEPNFTIAEMVIDGNRNTVMYLGLEEMFFGDGVEVTYTKIRLIEEPQHIIIDGTVFYPTDNVEWILGYINRLRDQWEKGNNAPNLVWVNGNLKE